MSGISVPSAREQADIIREIEKTSRLKVGDSAYLISAQWWNHWKEITRLDTSLSSNPINNDRLIKNGHFDQDKREGRDFLVLTKDVWDKLFEWFGGGPVVTVPVANNQGKPVPVLRMLNLTCHFQDRKETIEISRYDTVEMLRSSICAVFTIDNVEETRVFDYWNLSVRSELQPLTKQLSQFTLYNFQDVLLDYKESDGQWHVNKLKQAKERTISIRKLTTSNQFQTTQAAASSFPTRYVERVPGVVGLSNLGNTCYFNSGVQCLMHTQPLMNVFLRTAWRNDLNTTNPLGSRGVLAGAFGELATEIWSGNWSVLRPDKLKQAIGCFASQFSGWGQQDAHELITFMLDGIHEDLNRKKVKEITEQVSGNGENDLEIAEAAWRMHLGRNDSIIVDIFHGQMRSEILCPDCQNVCVVFDPFTTLSLPLSMDGIAVVHVTYVPADFARPHQDLVLTVPTHASEIEYVKAISKELDCDVDVIFGYPTTSSIDWGLSESRTTDRVFAFEITDRDSFYIPVVIKMVVRRRSVAVAGPFLIKVQDSSVSEADVSEAACEQLKCLWQAQEVPLNPGAAEFMNSIELPSESFEDGKRFMAIFPIGVSDELARDGNTKCTTKSVVTLELNSEFTTPESGFSLESLVRHYRETNTASTLTLDQCMKYFSMAERLSETNQWYCPTCRKHVCAQKKMDIWSVPKCLIIHLNRFKKGSSHYMSQKIDTNIDFPDTLDMREYVIGPQNAQSSLKYRLYAVAEHSGTCNFGHYTAKAIVASEQGTWYSFNDGTVMESKSSLAHTPAAYILFYEHID